MSKAIGKYRNAVVEVTKEFTFDSCHHLNDYVGDCAKPHGHSYRLQVTVKGTVDITGMVLDFKKLKEEVSPFVKLLDHDDLNTIFKFNPTAENMVVYLFDAIEGFVQCLGVKLCSVKLWETSTSYAEYKGE